MGLSLALLGEISFKNGQVVQDNFDTYQVIRMDTAPQEIRVQFVPSGRCRAARRRRWKPGVPPIAPALTNAIFAATGKRIRRLPVGEQLKA